MMMYLLDSDVVILFLKHHPRVVAKIRSLVDQQLAISTLTIGEIAEGLHHRDAKKQEKFAQFTTTVEVLPVDRSVATTFGELRYQLRKSNQLIGDIDTLIAATAIVHQVPLLTANIKHYERISQLEVISVI